MKSSIDKLKKVSREWDRLGELDPFWAALTAPGKENSWNDAEFIETGKKEISEVIEYLELENIEFSHSRALDFGCGPGRLSIGMSDYFSEVVGVDIAKSMIDIANGLLSGKDNVHFVLNQEELLSIFSDEEFSFVYSNHVLQHNPKEFSLGYIREFHRILVRGGIAAFFLPVGRRKTFKNIFRGLMPEFLEPVIYKLRFGSLPQMEMHGIESKVIKNIASEIGFEVLTIRENDDPSQRWQNCFYVLRKQ